MKSKKEKKKNYNIKRKRYHPIVAWKKWWCTNPKCISHG